MEGKTVLISAPVCNRAWILPYYLRNLYNLEYNKMLISIYWIVNNSNDETFQILSKFQHDHKNEYRQIKIDIFNNEKIPEDNRSELVRKQHIYAWLSLLRNRILDKCVEWNCDYLLSCDTDILMRKDCLTKLLSHDKAVCAGLIGNGYLVNPSNPFLYPNILKKLENRNYKHIYNYYVKNKTGLIEVDFTGAVICISKEVCKTTKYAPDLTYGEDLPWSKDVQKAGYKLYCDCSCYNQHVMSKELLEKFKSFGVEDEQRN
jgi:hypothetical protein